MLGSDPSELGLEDVSMALRLLIPTRTTKSFQKTSLVQQSINTLCKHVSTPTVSSVTLSFPPLVPSAHLNRQCLKKKRNPGASHECFHHAKWKPCPALHVNVDAVLTGTGYSATAAASAHLVPGSPAYTWPTALVRHRKK